MSAEGMALIGRMGWQAIQRIGWRPAAVGGLTMGADPVAYAIAAASFGSGAPVDAFSVRKESEGSRHRAVRSRGTSAPAMRWWSSRT